MSECESDCLETGKVDARTPGGPLVVSVSDARMKGVLVFDKYIMHYEE